MSTRKIKDFIYIDGDRLNSLYSQVKAGLVERIIEARLDSVTRDKSQERILKGNKLEAQFIEEKNSSEIKVLHDYMYAELEDLLAETIVTPPSDLNAENYTEKLSGIFILKVSGKAEISDFRRSREIVGKINTVLEGSHYLSEITVIGGNPQKSKQNVQQSSLPNKKSLLEYLKTFDDPKKLAQNAGVLQDEKSLKYIDDFIDVFCPDGIEITILTSNSDIEIAYRGLIDDQWLRIKPSALRHLYAGASQTEWIMVGQITHIPESQQIVANVANDDSELNIDQIVDNLAEESKEGNLPNTQRSFRGGFSDFFKLTRNMEKEFAINSDRTEVVVMPLAIYRETSVVVKEKVQ